MGDLFFYGTLRNRALLEIVLGRTVAPDDAVPSVLPDHRVRGVSGAPFPMIVPEPGHQAQGLVLRGPSPADLARLQYYEGGFEYDLRSLEVLMQGGGAVRASVFFPPAGSLTPAAEWSLADWERDWGALSLRAAKEAMHWFGQMTPAQLADRIQPMRRRAAAWLAAQERTRGASADPEREIVIEDHRHAYVNFFALDELDLRARRFDGTMGPLVNRGALVVGEAAVVMPYDPVHDLVLLTQQFRAPVLLSGSADPWVWEPVAGLIDPGETALQAARREAQEEAGLELGPLEPAGQVYSSTGSSTEFLHLFIGLTDLSGIATGQNEIFGGLAQEGEDIRRQVLSYDVLMAGVDEGHFVDMPLVTTALWLARHRTRLRAAFG